MQRLFYGTRPLLEVGFARLFLGFLTILAAPSVAHAQDATETPTLVLSNVTLIDGTGAEPRPHVTVLIEDGVIAGIVEGEAPEAPADATVADLSGWLAEVPAVSGIRRPEEVPAVSGVRCCDTFSRTVARRTWSIALNGGPAPAASRPC